MAVVQHYAIQLFKLGRASMRGCSRHGDAWLCQEGHEHLRPRPHSNPRHVVSLLGSMAEHLYVCIFFPGITGSDHTMARLPTGMLA